MRRSRPQGQRGKSSIHARIEHVLAHRKNRFGLFIRTTGITGQPL